MLIINPFKPLRLIVKYVSSAVLPQNLGNLQRIYETSTLGDELCKLNLSEGKD